MATKKGIPSNFFSLSSFIFVTGFGIWDGYIPGYRIRDKHPGSATLLPGELSVWSFTVNKVLASDNSFFIVNLILFL